MNHPTLLHTVIAKLNRSELTGVNGHTLPIALARAEHDAINFEGLTERQIAILILDRISYPETMAELEIFLKPAVGLATTVLLTSEITADHAVPYMRWLNGFLNDPDPNIQKNARTLLRWLVTNYHENIATDPTTLNGLRQIANDPATGWKNAAFIVYGLGLCGVPEDYDYIIRLAEVVIEHDREHIDMLVDALHRLYPPALINALGYFLEAATPNSKQFTAGLYLLAQVSEIDDKQFWTTFYDDMDRILAYVNDNVNLTSGVTRILDRLEKHLALVGSDDE